MRSPPGSGTTHGYVAVNGLDMYYEIHGDGPPVVLLHGAMGTIQSCFEHLLPRLATRHRVVAVELQGHGHTADIDRPLSYDHMTEDVAALVRALDLGVPDIVGYSMGGAVGLQLAMDHQTLVRRLVYAGGAYYHPSGYYHEIVARFESGSPDDMAGTRWERAYRRVAPRPDKWTALVAKVNTLDRAMTAWTTDQLRSVQAPTLLVIGDADIVRPEHTVQMFRLLGGGVPGDLAALPDSHLAVLPGTTHEGLLQRVDWLHPMIEGFLAHGTT